MNFIKIISDIRYCFDAFLEIVVGFLDKFVGQMIDVGQMLVGYLNFLNAEDVWMDTLEAGCWWCQHIKSNRSCLDSW